MQGKQKLSDFGKASWSYVCVNFFCQYTNGVAHWLLWLYDQHICNLCDLMCNIWQWNTLVKFYMLELQHFREKQLQCNYTENKLQYAAKCNDIVKPRKVRYHESQ